MCIIHFTERIQDQSEQIRAMNDNFRHKSLVQIKQSITEQSHIIFNFTTIITSKYPYKFVLMR